MRQRWGRGRRWGWAPRGGIGKPPVRAGEGLCVGMCLRHTRSRVLESGCVLGSGCHQEGRVLPGQPYSISTRKPFSTVLTLSLPSPATPGPCTQPRTSWKTSATCSTTWPTSWTRCWTEPCSLLPLPTSGCSAGAPRDGGRAELAPSGASGSLQPPPSPHFALRLGTRLPLLARPWLRITRAGAAAGRFPRGSGISHQTGSRRRAQRGCTRGPGGHGEALAPLHRAEEPPQGTFLFPRCIAESCL